MLYLAGDIGGTNTRLSLFEENRNLVKEHVFPSKKYGSLKEILKEFLEEKVFRGCFGIAGPIENNVCHATNLPWVVDGNALGEEVGIEKVFLINDLLANAYGLRALKEDEFYILNAGDVEKGNSALISPGTGLGEAGLFWNGKDHIPFPSEGGHADFAPFKEGDIDLLQYLQKKFGHVSYERVISGPGIANIYEFLTKEKKLQGFSENIEEKELPKAITKGGMEGSPEAAVQSLDWFISLFGAEAGNTALKFLAISGVYLGGGIAPKIMERMKKGAFMDAFVKKGRFEKLMQSIPVKIVLNDKAALLGAFEYALLKKESA